MFPTIAETYSPPAPKRKRRKPRQAPLRTCGQCAGTFRSWKAAGLCGKCQEDGSRRPRTTAGGPNVVELDGPGDDGSLHYLATGKARP